MVGDVVLVPFPFTDLSSSKKRPVLVLSYVGTGDWIVCEITTRQSSQPGNIAIISSDFRTGGLNRPSVVRFNRLFTLNDSLFIRTFGRLTEAKQSEIGTAVRSLFSP